MSVSDVVSILFVWVGWSVLSTAAQGGEIRVSNHETGSTIRYPVALLRGELADRTANEPIGRRMK